MNFISVDLQKDFTDEGGKHFRYHPSVDFIRETLVPEFRQRGWKTAEIISDYRLPRPGDRDDSCNPGTTGYESILSEDVKKAPVWIKCMNSPIWVRENIGNAFKTPGMPYQDGGSFQKWVDGVVGPMNNGIEVYLFGLTLDCCVLSTAQELSWRGYDVKIIKEATDTYSGSEEEKNWLFEHTPVSNWAEGVSFREILH